MAFEDDMIEAGYSDEEEYLESLFDEADDYYNRQQEIESRYEEYDPSYYEEIERERREKELKWENEKKCVDEWKKRNPKLDIIWRHYFNTISYFAQISNMDNRYFAGLDELYELKKWLNERKCFETERQKQNWSEYINRLISLYQNELFKFYFPDDEKYIDVSIVSKQARELSLLELHEPSLWKSICSSNVIVSKYFNDIEWSLFWIEIYNREMDYEYWKDTNIEQYNLFAKQWIADYAFYIYGGWESKHETEKAEWKDKNLALWEKYKKNFEIREINKFIQSKIEEYDKKVKEENLNFEDLWEIDDVDLFDIVEEKPKTFLPNIFEKKPKPFLPDIEVNTEIPFDTSTLNHEVQKYIKEEICSIDLNKLSVDASSYADEALTQLWVFTNRDDWEMEELKKRHEYLFRNGKKYSTELLNWWKEKYQSKWNAFISTNVPLFKRHLEIVLKFRAWALDGNKELFFSLGEKYLTYWKKTIKFMYGYDINQELGIYFCNDSRYNIVYWGEDIDYIKQHTSKKDEIEIWQKELQDKVIWNVFFKDTYHNHYMIDSMYRAV